MKTLILNYIGTTPDCDGNEWDIKETIPFETAETKSEIQIRFDKFLEENRKLNPERIRHKEEVRRLRVAVGDGPYDTPVWDRNDPRNDPEDVEMLEKLQAMSGSFRTFFQLTPEKQCEIMFDYGDTGTIQFLTIDEWVAMHTEENMYDFSFQY
jgi:hypothetical protein